MTHFPATFSKAAEVNIYQFCSWLETLPPFRISLLRLPFSIKKKNPNFQKRQAEKKSQQFMDSQVFTSSLAQSFLQIMDHPRCDSAATKFTEIGQRTRGILDIPHDFDSCNLFKHTTNATLWYTYIIIISYIYSIDWTIHIAPSNCGEILF